MYLSTVYMVHICEKQLLKLTTDILHFNSLCLFFSEKSPSADIARQHHLLLSFTRSDNKKLLLVVCSVTLLDSYACVDGLKRSSN